MAIIEPMTPEEEVRLRLAAGISPSTSTEYMLRHIPLWVKMSILRRNAGIGGEATEGITTFDFTTNTYRENGSTVSLGDISEFIRLSSATMWQDGQLVEVGDNIPRISGEGLLIEPQSTNLATWSEDISNWSFKGSGGLVFSDETPSPRLGSMADRVVLSDASTTLEKRITSALGDNTNYSVFLKHAGTQYVRIIHNTGGSTRFISIVDVVNGELVHKGGGTALTATAWYCLKLPNGWVKLVLEAPYIPTWVHSVRTVDSEYNNVSGSFYIWGLQFALDPVATTYIPTYGTSATRAPDILNIPLLPTQTLTGDWDAGVTYGVMDNIATFTGHGYIRNITVETL